jgi:uncharacterized tellurite resistance protein B-like protein
MAHITLKPIARADLRVEVAGAGGLQTAPAKAPRRGHAWFGPVQPVAVGNFILPGFVYVGHGLTVPEGSDPEPALIDPTLDVDTRQPDWSGAHLDYWPSYSNIPAASRAAYLTWLAGGRRHPDVPIGYVFLFFYGLERRVLIDAAAQGDPSARAELPAIAEELRALSDLYSHYAFQRYAPRLLEAVDFLMASQQDVDETTPPPLEAHAWQIPFSLRIGLGEFARTRRPVPSAWAQTWALAHPQIATRSPVTRCPQEFAEQFAYRYGLQCGDALLVTPTGTRVRLDYHGASSGLPHAQASIDVPDVFDSAQPVAVLKDIVDRCNEDLNPFSRWLGRNTDGRGTLAAAALLPSNLLPTAGPQVQALIDWMEPHLAGRDFAVIDGGDLASRWTGGTTQFGKRDATAYAQLLAALGYGIEPDVRMGGTSPNNGPLVVFREEGPSPASASPAYAAATTLVHLATAVATADGAATADEVEHITTHIETNLDLSPPERRRLRAHLEWLLARGVMLTGLQARLDRLPRRQRELIAEFLTLVAAADGVIEPAEVKTLTKIHRMLGLEPADLLASLAIRTSPTEPAPAPVADPVPAAAVPRSGRHSSDEPPAGITLDPTLVEARLAETSHVAALLSDIFTDDRDALAGPTTHPTVPPQPPAMDSPRGQDQVGVSTPGAVGRVAAGGSVAGLDAPHSQLLSELRGLTHVSRGDFECLAERHHVLPDGAIDVLNEACYDRSGEPLLQGEDPIDIRDDLMKELLA